MLWGGPAFVLIVALVALDRRGRSITSRTAAALGAASFSIHLIHPYVIRVAGKLIGLRVDLHTWAGIAVTCAVLGAVCLSGYVCHVWIEQPMLTALSRSFGRACGTVEPSA